MSNAADPALTGALRRFNAYPECKDSGVEWLGEIPAGWEVKRLKEVAAIRMSNVDKKSVEGEEPVELCNYTDVYYHDRITADMNFMKATAPREQVRRFTLHAGDVLITKDSESWTDIAVPAVVAEDLPNVLCGYHLAQIRPGKTLFGPYLARAIGAVGPRDQFRVSANGVTRFAIGTEAITTSLFAIPPYPEQQAIASFLDRETARIDALVAKKERLITLLQERRTALITCAVTKGLDAAAPMKDSGVEWLGEIPVHWEVRRLKRLFKVVNGATPPSGDLTYWDGDIPWVTPEDLGELAGTSITSSARNITAAGYQVCGTTLVPAGSLVLSTRAPIGHLALAGVDLCTNQGCKCMVFRTEADRDFFFYELSAARAELQSLGQGSTFKELGTAALEDVELTEPPSREQRAIATFLDRETSRIDALVTRVRTAINHLIELRTALISAAVTGKIDVREAAQ